MNFGFFLTAGWYQVDFNPVINAFTSRGYEVGEFNRVILGLSGYILWDNFVFVGNWFRFIGVEGISENKRVYFNNMVFSGDVGYVLYHNNLRERRFMVYPSFGVGYSRFEVKGGVIENTNFNDLLENPQQSIYINHSQYIGIIALRGHFDFGFNLGLGFGYTFPIFKGKWDTDFGEVYNAPDVDSKGLFGQIMVGFATDKW